MWDEFTTVEAKKKGTAFFLELREGKVKNTVRSLGKELISSETGLAQIIAKLDTIYQEDDALVSYRVYSKFEKFMRPEDMQLQTYISVFEKMVADLKKQQIVLPEAVLAYRLLNSANMSKDKVELALATVKNLTLKDMSQVIGRIFSVQTNIASSSSSYEEMGPVKTEAEECNYANSYSDRGKYRGSFQRGRSRQGFSSKSRVSRGYNHPYSFRGSCFKCGGRGHLARDCFSELRKEQLSPQYLVETDTESKSEETHITLFVSNEEHCLMSSSRTLVRWYLKH